MKKMARPISPYLSIYKPQLGSIFSILQRISGVLLAFLVLVCFFLFYIKDLVLSFYSGYRVLFVCFKVNDFSVAGFEAFIGSLLFFSLLLGIYHFCFSIRFLYWAKTGGDDADYGLNLETLEFSTYLCGLVVLLSSLGIWLML